MDFSIMVGMAHVTSYGLAFNCIAAFALATLIYRYPLVLVKNSRIQRQVEKIRVGVAVLLALGGLEALVELIVRNI
jgi:chitinase